MVPHFPQSYELRLRSLALHNSGKTRARSEIQIVFRLAIPEPQANLRFNSPRIVTHGEFETAVYRPTRTVSETRRRDRRIATFDVGYSNAILQDVQLVLGCALWSLDTPGRFGVVSLLLEKMPSVLDSSA